MFCCSKVKHPEESTMGHSKCVTLGYWKIRGLAQGIRLLMNYAGQAYEEVLYEQGDGPEYSREEWDKVKYTLGFDFPNLPYIIDGDLKLTQTNAIIRYLGKKHDLLGSDIKMQAYSDMMLENAMDWRNDMVSVVYSPDFGKLIDPYFERTHIKLGGFEKFLKGKTWFAGGSTPTTCDFHMYELLSQHRLIRPTCLTAYPGLQKYMETFEALPKIKAFLESDRCIKAQVNNKSASWNP